MKTYGNFIDGRWTAVRGARVFSDVNPADRRDVVGKFQRSGRPQINDAVRAAQRAFPAWSAMPAPKRALILFEAARRLEAQKAYLAGLLSREMGKSADEASGDVQEAIDTAYFFAGEGRRLYGQTVPSELADKFCLTFRRPVGVCGLITPWNFPLAVPSWKVFPALICGNTIVLKPAEDTPLLGLLFAELLAEAGLPKGVFNAVAGLGEEAGEALVRHPGVSLVSFTGSSAVGARIASLCGRALKRHSLELGGKNAQIVLEDADLDLAVKGAVWGAFATAGQRCTATSRLLLHEKIYDRFLKAFVGQAERFETSPVINAKQLRTIERYVSGAKKEGARLLCGGAVDRRGEKKHAYFYRPTVFDKVSPEMTIAREEVFGPVVAVIKIKNHEEAVRIANDTGYGLSSSVYTRDVSRAMRSIPALETGITYLNSPTIGAEAHLPFGGTKRTGNGHREAGVTALDIFSEWKTVYIDASGALQRAQIDS